MRILHTSDWHLGRALHQEDLHAFQVDFLDQIHAIVRAENVDVLLVAGDVFDRAVPPVESVALFTEAVRRLSEHCTIIVTSGNHDSAIRLGYGSGLFRDGIHLVTDTAATGSGIDVRSDAVKIRIYPIPYLFPDHAREVLKRDDEVLPRSHQAVISAAVDRVRADLAQQADTPTAVIVVAHAFVVGGSASDSERDISVGGVDYVTADTFAGIDYVALGHLHGPQQVTAPEGSVIRYSGSPLRYSFSEATQSKSVTLIDVTPDGVLEVTAIPLRQPRPMVVLTGDLSDLIDDANQTEHADSWVQAFVTDDARPPNLVSQIRQAFPHVLSIQHRPRNSASLTSDSPEIAAELDPVEMSKRFIRDVANRDASPEEVLALRDAYEAARSEVER